MGCLNTKPKPAPHTIVIHSCDYHGNGIVHSLKSRSPSPVKYAARESANAHQKDEDSKEQPTFVRQRHATPTRSHTSSPHITLPSTPEEERDTTLNVLDAEDLEPAPTPERDVRAKTRLSDEKSQATVSKVMMHPVSSINPSPTQDSKQSVLSSRDTLTIEELDSDLDDFSRMSQDQAQRQSVRSTDAAPRKNLLPLRKQKQVKEDLTLESTKVSHNIESETAKLRASPKPKNTPKHKRKHKEKVKFDKVKRLSKESLHVAEAESENIEQNKESKIQSKEIILPNSVEKVYTIEANQSNTAEDFSETRNIKKQKQIANEKIKSEENIKKHVNISKADFENKPNKTEFWTHVKHNDGIICEPLENEGGICVAYREVGLDEKHPLKDTNTELEGDFTRNTLSKRIASPLPKDVYEKELERVRLNRKRKHRGPRKNPEYTPRVPKPGDTEALGYLGSNVIFRNKSKPSPSSKTHTDMSSTENISDIGSESILSLDSDLPSLNKSNELMNDPVMFSDKTLEKDMDLYSLDSATEEKNYKFFSDKKNSLILGELPYQNDVDCGTSSSDVYTKQKLLYAKFERRPYSESVLRLAGRPPLPPDTSSNVARPVSEKVRRAQAYSRYFTPDMDLN